MDRGAAHRLDDPGRQVRKVLRHAPAADGRAMIEPGELGETVPLVVDEILVFDARAGFEDDDVDALLRQFVAERAAAGARTYDDDHTVVVEIVRSCHDFLPIQFGGGRLQAPSGRASSGAGVTPPSKPFDVVKTAGDVAALGIGFALVAEMRP